MSNPLVSILIPVYNVEAFLPQCLDSVIGQTYQNLQIVLIDDGSTDKSWQIMQEYIQKDNRMEIYHQDNAGVATTRNHLLDKIKGEYFLFIDSDDWIESDMVEFLISKQEESNADLVMCENVINDALVSGNFTQKILLRHQAIERFLYHIEFRGSLWNKLIKTNLLSNCKFQSGISLGEDALFCWHILQYVTTVLMTDRQLYHYRMNNESICHSNFGPKKLSAHRVWDQICKETGMWWPEYLSIAHARHCIEDVLLLRDAIKSNYAVESDLLLLKDTIAKSWTNLFKCQITTLKMKLFAIGISKFSCIAKIF